MAGHVGGQFQMKGLIGQGAFGQVYLLEDPSGNKRALKVISFVGKAPKVLVMALQEVMLLANLDHPHILKYIHGVQDGSSLYLVTEFCSNGDIDGYLERNKGRKLEEEILLTWVKQITEALEFLHSSNIIHRDLKTANVFLDENWDTKLGDFGIARILSSPTDLATTVCGTPMYMSPEVFEQKPYSAKTDIYSLGVMMLAMGSMEYGVEANAHHIMIFKIIHNKPPSLPKGYSDKVSDLMTKMLIADPDKRPSARELLQHSSLTSLKLSKPKQKNPDLKLVEDDKSFDWRKLQGTLTVLDRSSQFSTDSTKTDQVYGRLPNMTEEFAANPVMSVVERTLTNMNIHVSATTFMERQAEMLKMYCLKCLDDDEELFGQGSDILDTQSSEEDIEEALIALLGHEKFALCGIQLLYYKNFTFLMRQ